MSEDTTKGDVALTATPATSDNSGLPMRPLGRTGLNVSAIGFGAAPIGDLYARLDENAAIGAVAAAIAYAGANRRDAAYEERERFDRLVRDHEDFLMKDYESAIMRPWMDDAIAEMERRLAH